MRKTRDASAPRLMRMPISCVRALTEKASTPAIPTMAITIASAPNDAMNSAFKRRGATVASRTSSSVATLSMSCRGYSSRIARKAAGRTTFGSVRVRMTITPLNTSSCAIGWNTVGVGSVSRPWSRVSPTTPTTVRQSPETGMNFSTSPVHATRRPIGS